MEDLLYIAQYGDGGDLFLFESVLLKTYRVLNHGYREFQGVVQQLAAID